MDEKPDFASYDYETLQDVYAHINERKYPERRAEVKSLLDQRRSAPETLAQSRWRHREQRYDTFFQRFFAALIDGLILWLIGTGLTVLIFTSPGIVSLLLTIVAEFIGLTYYIYFHWQGGQTAGKYMLSLRVVDNADEGLISFQQAVIRESLPVLMVGGVTIVSMFFPEWHNREVLQLGEATQYQSLLGSVLLLWVMLEMITLLFHPRHRAIHDLLAGTVVVNELPPHD